MKSLKISTHITLIAILSVLILSCESGIKSEKGSKNYLPVARGADGVILIVMDSALWADSLGVEIKRTFSEYIPGLPQPEPYFTIRHINPLKLNDILKAAKNMIFVTTLDRQSSQSRSMRRYHSKESLARIQADSSLFRFANKDAYARGQEILHLFGQNQELLINKIRTNRSELRNYFLNVEKKRIAKTVYSKDEKNISKKLEQDHGFTLKIPYGYDLAESDKNFAWIRFLDPEFEKNVFVHYGPYISKEPFRYPVDHREMITSKKMRDVQKSDIYMTTQNFPHQTREVNFKGKYAVETRGLWKLSDISGGGPFVSYVFVDESQKRLYYLEGYAYAPGDDKRQHMREIEVILDTFRSGEELL